VFSTVQNKLVDEGEVMTNRQSFLRSHMGILDASKKKDSKELTVVMKRHFEEPRT